MQQDLPWSVSSWWCKTAWWSTWRGSARKQEHWKPEMEKNISSSINISSSSNSSSITNQHTQAITNTWKNVQKKATRVDLVTLYQNLNSGSRRIKGRNSSLALVGSPGPSSTVGKEAVRIMLCILGQNARVFTIRKISSCTDVMKRLL